MLKETLFKNYKTWKNITFKSAKSVFYFYSLNIH